MARHTMMFISTVLGLFFIYSGFAKLNPMLNAELHVNMKKHFVNYARVAPLRTYFDKRLKASDYRQLVAGMEIAGGTGMVILSGRLSLPISQLIVLSSAAFMIHTHIILGDPMVRAVTLIAASLMVVIQMLFIQFTADKGMAQNSERKKRKKSDVAQETIIAAGEGSLLMGENEDKIPEDKSKGKKHTSKKKKKGKVN